MGSRERCEVASERGLEGGRGEERGSQGGREEGRSERASKEKERRKKREERDWVREEGGEDRTRWFVGRVVQ